MSPTESSPFGHTLDAATNALDRVLPRERARPQRRFGGPALAATVRYLQSLTPG